MFKMFKDESGASLLEYMFLAALILVVCLVGVARVGSETKKSVDSTQSNVTSAVDNGFSG